MANFLAAYDPRRQRRMEYTEKCKDQIIIFNNLEYNELFTEKFTILWAVNKTAPIDSYQDENKAGVLFGDAIRPGSRERLTAHKITQEWHTSEEAQKHFYDGYYCSICYDSAQGIKIGGDILGLFPIYYYSDGEITLAASSPELFRYHESFKPELCRKGLTGMLMSMHSVEGLTLWKGVSRLQAGHLLISKPEEKALELSQYDIPLSRKYTDTPFSQQIELIHEKMGQAVKRHAPEEHKYSFLFSGGLDSRMLAGYLQNRKDKIDAVTFGKASDMEMQVAKKTIKALPFSHKAVSRPFNHYPFYADLTARWEHGLQGFNTIQYWGLKEIFKNTETRRIISGVHHDSLFYFSYDDIIYQNDSSERAFEKILETVTQWGITAQETDILLKEEIPKSTSKYIIDSLQKRFYKYADSNHRRAWRFRQSQRGRFHHGGMLWKMSFAAWPVVPILDSEVIEVIGGMPYATLSGRRAQRTLVTTYFPKLARIPLDGNSGQPEALIPTWQFQLKQAVANSKLFDNTLYQKLKYRLWGPWNKNLFYHRIFDINNAGWKKVRQEAEPARSLTEDMFNQEKLLQLLPTPEEYINKKLGAASGTKSLIGFLLWLRQHLS